MSPSSSGRGSAARRVALAVVLVLGALSVALAVAAREQRSPTDSGAGRAVEAPRIGIVIDRAFRVEARAEALISRPRRVGDQRHLRAAGGRRPVGALVAGPVGPVGPVDGHVVFFCFGASEPSPQESARLAAWAARAAARSTVRVDGHADGVGSVPDNDRLSRRRAESVARLLSAAGHRVDVRAFGERRARAAEYRADGTDDPAGRRLNRRAEVWVVR